MSYCIELLQEVWLGNDELVEMYEKRLRDAGYDVVKLARTNNRGDGMFFVFFHYFTFITDNHCYRQINMHNIKWFC